MAKYATLRSKPMKFFGNGWDAVLEDEFEKEYFKDLLVKQKKNITNIQKQVYLYEETPTEEKT